jgi:hypothetical protein
MLRKVLPQHLTLYLQLRAEALVVATARAIVVRIINLSDSE